MNTQPVLRVHNPSANRTDLQKVLEESNLNRLFLGLCGPDPTSRDFYAWFLFDLDVFRQRVADVLVSESWACTTSEGVPNGQRVARFDMAAVSGILLASSGPLDVDAILRERRDRERRTLSNRYRQLVSKPPSRVATRSPGSDPQL